MKALENLYHRRRPADFLRHGIRQRARLVAWKDCRSLPKPSGSLADHERGDAGLPVPPERKLDTRGGQRGIQEFSPSGPFGTGAAGPIGGLARASPARLAGVLRPALLGRRGLRVAAQGRRTQGTGAGDRGPGAGRRQRRLSAGCTHPRARSTCAPSRPAVLSPPKAPVPPSARGSAYPTRAPGPFRRAAVAAAGFPARMQGVGRGGGCSARLAAPCAAERSQASLFFTNFPERVCARAHSPCKKYCREVTRVSLIYLIVLNQ